MKKYIDKILTDIVLVGSVDVESSPVETTINHEFLYFKFNDEGWVKLSSVNQMSELIIADSMGVDFSFEIDEDDEYTSISIRDLLVIDTISDAVLVGVDEYKLDGKVKALEIMLDCDQSFFIDATYYTGIKIGGETLKRGFCENNSGYVKS
jgi:hypothetical protein